MLQRIDELINQEIDFAFETTLTTLSHHGTIKFAKEKEYSITLVFFLVNNVSLALKRVKTRVREGGHSIPEDVIIRRYNKGINNLLNVFVNLCDYWLVINNTTEPSFIIAKQNIEMGTVVHKKEIWDIIKITVNETNKRRLY